MTVADRIKARREELGLTQADLALQVGCRDKSTISRIESSGNDISMKNIKRIAPHLYTTPSFLLGWTENPAEKIDVDHEYLETAVKMYETYKQARPEIRVAVDALLHLTDGQ